MAVSRKIPLSNAHAAWVAEHLEGRLLVWLGVRLSEGRYGIFTGGAFAPLPAYHIDRKGRIWRPAEETTP
jgi:hypothetical protein